MLLDPTKPSHEGATVPMIVEPGYLGPDVPLTRVSARVRHRQLECPQPHKLMISICLTGGLVDMSMQTQPMHCLHKGSQVGLPSLLKLAYPTLHKETKDDLVLDLPKYALLKEMYRTMPMGDVTPLMQPINILRRPIISSNEACTSTSRDKVPISDAFKDHIWYPERRPGRGPKYPKTDLDR